MSRHVEFHRVCAACLEYAPLLMTEIVLSQVQAVEMGFLRKVYCMTLCNSAQL